MYAIPIKPKKRSLSLSKIETTAPREITKESVLEERAALEEELSELQDLMWGAKTHSVLVVLQGRDTAGKDGTIKGVVGALNPRGVHVVSFGVPTEEEREHDFLWRVHRHAPRAGEFSIFNRSHYEDVLVTRVHDLVPKKVWQARYAQINAFEETLASANAIILKFFLHISKDEQRQRLLEREEDATKAWKLNPSDWRERALWKDFTEAYEDVFKMCHSAAPWYIVPADQKWYRNLCVSEAIVKALRPHRITWVDALGEKGKVGLAELDKYKKKNAIT
jgi:PPK2 family polyphosphate:nucleotide phosphotransferase